MKLSANIARIARDFRVLASMPNRFAGSRSEQHAADWVEARFRKLGLANVHQHRFGFPNWWPHRHELYVGRRIPNCKVVCGTMTYSGSTGPRGVSGDLVYLQTGTEHDFTNAGNLVGKIGLIIGSLSLQEEAVKQRILQSRMAALIAVDARIPSHKETSSGMAPQWTRGFNLPCVTAPLLGAMELVKQLPLRAKVIVEGEHRMDRSQNVIGEINGRSEPNKVILVSAHHDAVWKVSGIDDNGSGVAALLELATLLRRRPLRRTIRFVSYGVEERLSVGAYMYMRHLGKAARAIQWCVNFDTFAAHAGEDTIWTTGTPTMNRFVRQYYDRARHHARFIDAAMIYSDQFPLNATGVPSLFISRTSLLGPGWWNIHTSDDNLENVSPSVAARTISTIANLIVATDSKKMPFPRAITPRLTRDVRRGIRNAYRHPWPLIARDGIRWLSAP